MTIVPNLDRPIRKGAGTGVPVYFVVLPSEAGYVGHGRRRLPQGRPGRREAWRAAPVAGLNAVLPNRPAPLRPNRSLEELILTSPHEWLERVASGRCRASP